MSAVCLHPGSTVFSNPVCELTNVHWQRGIVLMIQRQTDTVPPTNPASQGNRQVNKLQCSTQSASKQLCNKRGAQNASKAQMWDSLTLPRLKVRRKAR